MSEAKGEGALEERVKETAVETRREAQKELKC